jgi:hypothetical protein
MKKGIYTEGSYLKFDGRHTLQTLNFKLKN